MWRRGSKKSVSYETTLASLNLSSNPTISKFLRSITGGTALPASEDAPSRLRTTSVAFDLRPTRLWSNIQGPSWSRRTADPSTHPQGGFTWDDSGFVAGQNRSGESRRPRVAVAG